MQVTIGSNWCTLIADAANKEDIALRVAQIKKELSETDSVYDTEKLSERIAKLAGGVAVIKVRASLSSFSASRHSMHVLCLAVLTASVLFAARPCKGASGGRIWGLTEMSNVQKVSSGQACPSFAGILNAENYDFSFNSGAFTMAAWSCLGLCQCMPVDCFGFGSK